ILSFHTGRSVEQIAKDVDRDYYLSSEEAKEYGLIDDILTHQVNEAAKADK
ncbi:MAG: ATP-dependent Clp protease proteolytic subunit, partial [Thermoguttaceae bacterium]|nr:ATP-dependent Clp protease proteolytic subunit [Thermoguttaceae bacterium]